MQCFVGARRSGKTQHLIDISYDTGFPIVTSSAQMARAIEHQAMRMDKNIPKPICYRDHKELIGVSTYRNILIDEANSVLDSMLCAHVVAATVNGRAFQLANPALDLGLKHGLVSHD